MQGYPSHARAGDNHFNARRILAVVGDGMRIQAPRRHLPSGRNIGCIVGAVLIVVGEIRLERVDNAIAIRVLRVFRIGHLIGIGKPVVIRVP